MNEVVQKAINDAISIANESTQKEILDSEKARVSIYTKHRLPTGKYVGYIYFIILSKSIDGKWLYESHTFEVPTTDLHLLGEVTPSIEAIG